MRRILSGIGIGTILMACAVSLAPRAADSNAPRPAGTPRTWGRAAIAITFGIGDAGGGRWDGSIAVAEGRVVHLEGLRFEADDAIEGSSSWRCATRPAARRGPRRKVRRAGKPMPNGVLAVLDGLRDARVEVRTAQGGFGFRLSAIRFGRPLAFLGGRARAERVPPFAAAPARSRKVADERMWGIGALGPEPGTPEPSHEDEPSIAVSKEGEVWVAWISYLREEDGTRADVVRAARFEEGTWSDLTTLDAPGVHYGTQAAFDGAGRLWCIWAAETGGNFDLYARIRDGRAWGRRWRLTAAAGSDVHHRLAAGRDGRLWLAWQAVREGRARILVARLSPGGRAEGIAAADQAGDQWAPSIAADPKGGVWVAWDAYIGDSFDVYLRRFEAKEDGVRPAGSVVSAAATPRFEANPAVAVDAAGRVYVAWEESGAGWGKDTGFRIRTKGRAATRLYPPRAFRMAVLDEGRWREPAADLAPALPPELRRGQDAPRLGVDPAGRLWLAFRHRHLKYLRPWNRGLWMEYVVHADGAGWSKPIELARSAGRKDAAAALAFAPDGDLVLAWSGDGRSSRRPIPAKSDVHVGRIEADAVPRAEAIALVPRAKGEEEALPPVHPNEEADRGRLRRAKIVVEGRTYRLFRGDLHRHTDLSWDGTGDGSLLDMYRYALDAAGFDFIGSTDHAIFGVGPTGTQGHAWWRTEKLADLYPMPGRFATFYSYERSLSFPHGHRNVISARRGDLPVMPFLGPDGGLVRDDTRRLYEALRGTESVIMAHTSATGMGTDWAFHDPVLEPLVEIYQGCRNSYEAEGAPRAPTREDPGATQYRPEGLVSKALAKGYRLGFQASSDHGSTHVSYVCLWAEALTRRALIDAMRRRHAYGATDNILLVWRAEGGGKSYLMGDRVAGPGRLRFRLEVEGTAPIRQAVVIRDGRIVSTRAGEGPVLDLEYEDREPRAGTSFYYARVLQADGQLAWASPIWVERKGR